MKPTFGLFKDHLAKVLFVFVLGGGVAVMGLIHGTQDVSNILGNQITKIKTDIGTKGTSPSVVQY